MNTIIEKIRAELEGRKTSLKQASKLKYDLFLDVFVREYDSLLSFLSDLEKECEKPTNIDFEQELYKHFGQVKDFTLGMRIGQYFYNLCKEQTEKRWLEDRDGCFWDGVEEGKKAMREQMIRSAVEGEVVKDINNKLAVTAKNVNLDKFKFGEKVRIIIVKEDK